MSAEGRGARIGESWLQSAGSWLHNLVSILVDPASNACCYSQDSMQAVAGAVQAAKNTMSGVGWWLVGGLRLPKARPRSLASHPPVERILKALSRPPAVPRQRSRPRLG